MALEPENLAKRLPEGYTVEYVYRNNSYKLWGEDGTDIDFDKRTLEMFEEQAKANLIKEDMDNRSPEVAFLRGLRGDFDKQTLKQECVNVLLKEMLEHNKN